MSHSGTADRGFVAMAQVEIMECFGQSSRLRNSYPEQKPTSATKTDYGDIQKHAVTLNDWRQLASEIVAPRCALINTYCPASIRKADSAVIKTHW